MEAEADLDLVRRQLERQSPRTGDLARREGDAHRPGCGIRRAGDALDVVERGTSLGHRSCGESDGWRATTRSLTSRTMSAWAATKPSTISSTASNGSLISFLSTPREGSNPDVTVPASCLPRRRSHASGRATEPAGSPCY